MFIEYKPEDGDPRSWEFDPQRVRSGQAEVIEKRYGKPWDQWREDVRTGNAKARRVLLWHLLRLGHATLRYEDTPDFYMSELRVHHSVSELIELKDRLAKAKMDEHEREQVTIGLDIEITEAMAREGLETEPDDVPKAPSENSSEPTG